MAIGVSEDVSGAENGAERAKIGWSGAERSVKRAWKKNDGAERSAEREVVEWERSVYQAESADYRLPLQPNISLTS